MLYIYLYLSLSLYWFSLFYHQTPLRSSCPVDVHCELEPSQKVSYMEHIKDQISWVYKEVPGSQPLEQEVVPKMFVEYSISTKALKKLNSSLSAKRAQNFWQASLQKGSQNWSSKVSPTLFFLHIPSVLILLVWICHFQLTFWTYSEDGETVRCMVIFFSQWRRRGNYSNF